MRSCSGKHGNKGGTRQPNAPNPIPRLPISSARSRPRQPLIQSSVPDPSDRHPPHDTEPATVPSASKSPQPPASPPAPPASSDPTAASPPPTPPLTRFSIADQSDAFFTDYWTGESSRGYMLCHERQSECETACGSRNQEKQPRLPEKDRGRCGSECLGRFPVGQLSN